MAKPAPMIGRKFNRLLVISDAGRDSVGKLLWLCQCECGQSTTVLGESLRSSNTKSCGCFQREKAKLANLSHGRAKTLTHRIWLGMLTRCTNSNHHSYARYGARGITVCSRWRLFENFYADMGECPPGLSIDRINNDGNYEPANCRWASKSEQGKNTSSTRLITFDGETMCLSDWARRLGIVNASLRRRLKTWPLDKALTAPPKSV